MKSGKGHQEEEEEEEEDFGAKKDSTPSQNNPKGEFLFFPSFPIHI